jgi:hypothetical protein
MKIGNRIKRAVAVAAGAALFAAPALMAAPSANAGGEVFFPGVGYATGTTTWVDVVYCELQNDGKPDVFMEAKVTSDRRYIGGNIAIDPFLIQVSQYGPIWRTMNSPTQNFQAGLDWFQIYEYKRPYLVISINMPGESDVNWRRTAFCQVPLGGGYNQYSNPQSW